MTPAPFDYARPASIAEAVGMLGDNAMLLAGGQTLVPLLARRALRPRLIVDINRIAGLDRIELLADYIRIGALVRLEQARQSADVKCHVPLLAAALGWVANPVIRRRGTVIGNLIANTPGAELPAVARALGARFVLAGSDAPVPADASCPADAMVTHVLWPRGTVAAGFYEVSRRDGHSPVVCAGVAIGGTAFPAAIGIGGVCAGPFRGEATACVVANAWPQLPPLDALAVALRSDLSQPLHSDVQANADYRLKVAPEIIRRAVAQAQGRVP